MSSNCDIKIFLSEIVGMWGFGMGTVDGVFVVGITLDRMSEFGFKSYV
jgi:hypothetical protein